MRISRVVVPSAALALVAFAGLAALREGPEPTRAQGGGKASIVFVCRNGVAMSVWSARTFDRLAEERGLPFRAVSRASAATYAHVPLRMRLALALDGFRVGGYRPQVISDTDVRAAEHVILIDTELPPAVSATGPTVEAWGGFPPMRERYFASRTALRERVEELVARLAASPSPPR